MTESSGGAVPNRDDSDPNKDQEEGVKITDKRRIDPVTGKMRKPAGGPASEPAAGGPASEPASEPADPDNSASDLTVEELLREESEIDSQIGELTNDIQRLTAEYANYRKRVDRDREVSAEMAVATVLNELLPVLDDVQRARQHDELNGAFKTVGERLEAVTGKLGLERFGEAGDVFDPEQHEALTHSEGEGHAEPVCTQIYEPGYRFKGRVVRPARVAVSE